MFNLKEWLIKQKECKTTFSKTRNILVLAFVPSISSIWKKKTKLVDFKSRTHAKYKLKNISLKKSKHALYELTH